MDNVIKSNKELFGVVYSTTINAIVTAGALIVALAWNSAISSLFEEIWNKQKIHEENRWGEIKSRFAYAFCITILYSFLIYFMQKYLKYEKK